VVIKAPTGVRITVNGQETILEAVQSTFKTPELQPGQAYSYQVKAETVRGGQTVTEEKKVLVKAGQLSEVDFADLAPPQPAPSRVARVTFQVPEDARVWVDDVRWQMTGGQRTFTTPELVAGRNYFYEVKAEVTRGGKVLTQTHKITVAAGKNVQVEFTELPAQQTASR
jgi:uncharacterized protein (TIGR03000 family)